MKYKITKAEFDKLPPDLQKEYGEDGEEYVLNVEGGEDTGALKRAKDHEKKRRQDAEQKARDLEQQINDVQEQLEALQDKGGDDKNKDVEARWKKKLEAREAELTQQLEAQGNEINTLLVDNVAKSLASELSDTPGVLIPHIKSRLTIEKVDGKSVTRIKDADGEVSALTLDELKGEFQSNKDFASVIKGSGGSGSGASGGQGGQGGKKPEKPDLAKASPKEVADYFKSTKESGA